MNSGRASVLSPRAGSVAALLCALAAQAQVQGPVTVLAFEYPPLTSADGQGHATRLVAAAFAAQGLEARFEYRPPARAMQESLQQRHFLLGVLYPTDSVDRLQMAPLLRVELRVLMLTRRMPGSPPADAAAQQRALTGATIGLLPGYDAFTLFRDYGLQSVKTVAKDAALKMFASERFALMPCLADIDCPQLQAVLAAQGTPATLWPHPLLPPFDVGLVYERKDERLEGLAQQFVQGLAQLRRTGRYQELIRSSPN